MKTKRILIVLVILTLLAFVWIGILDRYHRNVNEAEDYLLYIVSTEQNRQQLMFYDVADGTHTPILPEWAIHRIAVNMRNRLAFLSDHEGDLAVYILDYPFTENTPVNITRNVSIDEYAPISWSPNGRYLAYETLQDDSKTLWAWDGGTRLRIHDYQEKVSELAWSQDGQLAFTEFYTFVFPYDGDPSEIYIWDGKMVAPVSQTPFGNDRFPAWKSDGKLAFLSEWVEGEYDIFVWDGVSKTNSIPDKSTYKNIAPNLTWYHSYPVWTSSDTLSFEATGQGDRNIQIYEWNGEIATNISQNPRLHNGGQSWRSDGYWAFVSTYYSGRLYIRDDKNQTVYENTEDEDQYVVNVPAWGQSGRLLFCSFSYSSYMSSDISTIFTLSAWDGTDIIEIAKNVRQAMWRNGEDVYCSM